MDSMWWLCRLVMGGKDADDKGQHSTSVILTVMVMQPLYHAHFLALLLYCNYVCHNSGERWLTLLRLAWQLPANLSLFQIKRL